MYKVMQMNFFGYLKRDKLIRETLLLLILLWVFLSTLFGYGASTHNEFRYDSRQQNSTDLLLHHAMDVQSLLSSFEGFVVSSDSITYDEFHAFTELVYGEMPWITLMTYAPNGTIE